MAEAITAKIFRFDPARDRAPYYRTYKVAVEGPTTVLTILKRVHEEKDHTLAYRDHICYKGICVTCEAKVNGKTVRTCSTLVKPGETVLIEPLTTNPVIRDVVTDLGTTVEREGISFLIKRGALVQIRKPGKSQG